MTFWPAKRMRIGVEVRSDRLVCPMPTRYTLDLLLAGMTPQTMQEAFDWGADQGREIVG